MKNFEKMFIEWVMKMTEIFNEKRVDDCGVEWYDVLEKKGEEILKKILIDVEEADGLEKCREEFLRAVEWDFSGYLMEKKIFTVNYLIFLVDAEYRMRVNNEMKDEDWIEKKLEVFREKVIEEE